MSFPNIPDVSPAIDININDVINLLIASIAFEELGLAHIINAEAEKIQSVLGTLYGQTPASPTIDDLIAIDNAVERVLRDVIKEEILLEFKLENILQISTSSTTTSTSTTTTTTSTSTTTTTTSTSTTTTTTSTSTTTTTTSTSTTTTTTSTSTTTTTTSTSTTTTTKSTSTTTTTTSTSTTTTTTSTSTTTTTTSTSTTTTTKSTSTSTTTTTTTSTTSTSSTTTCRPCLTGSGIGDLSTSCDPRFNRYNILDPRINASCCDPENTDPDNLEFRAELIPSPGGAQSLLLTADLATLTFQCMGNTLVIMGSGTVTLILSDGTNKSGPVNFTYVFQDIGTQGNQDNIGIVITGVSDSDFNFTTCGLRDLTGNITVGDCT